MFNNLLLVAAGGSFGSAVRYLCFVWINRLLPSAVFPWGTLLVNVLGCLCIGFLGGLAINKQFLTEHSRLFLFTGILGGFTTFSAFGLDTFYLIRNAQWVMAIFNVLTQVILGISATALGYWISKGI